MPIHEFDPERNACINPEDIIHRVPDMPKVVVTCFSHVTFARLLADVGGVEISHVKDAHSTCPVYKTTYRGQEIALFNTTVGAPSCVGALEDVFAMGAECAVVFGTCGVLEPEIADCSVIVPDAALRDEGTSYHYAPPAREIAVNERYLPAFRELLDTLECPYTVGKVWTTDAFYRETRAKMERRRREGCICVDMECASVAAMAHFRGKDVLQFFYAADNLAAAQWDKRSLGNEDRLADKDKIAYLAMEMAAKMAAEQEEVME